MKYDALHLLIVEDNRETTLLLEEAFTEMEDLRFIHPWIRTFRREYVVDPGVHCACYATIIMTPPCLDWRFRGAGSPQPLI